MKRLNKFITKRELERVLSAYRVSGMFMSGGAPLGNPAREVEKLRKKYDIPKGAGLDLRNGEFVLP